MNLSERVTLHDPPYTARQPDKTFWEEFSQWSRWPCQWVTGTEVEPKPCALAYRLKFTMEHEAVVRAHVSADERYWLFLDGRRIGLGSERGDAENWFFETYDLTLSKGPHTLVACVWSMGDGLPACFWPVPSKAGAPYAQMSVQHGFIFSPEGEWIPRLGTGQAAWEAKRLKGLSFIPEGHAWGTGCRQEIDGAHFPWGYEKGSGTGWKPVTVLLAGSNAGRFNELPPNVRRLRPATLPPMLDEPFRPGRVRVVIPRLTEAPPQADDTRIQQADSLPEEVTAWQAFLAGTPLTVPPDSQRRVIIDLEAYVCAYPELAVSGGAGSEIGLSWAESLFEERKHGAMGHRDVIEGKLFWGSGDRFRPGGKPACFKTFWWRCGRYLELRIRTAAQPLVLNSLLLRETRYPLEQDSVFSADHEGLARFWPLALRTLQMCAHETYFDCPYYEQLMYVGDTRLQALTGYTLFADSRLQRQSLRLLDASRAHSQSGLTQGRYPSRLTQLIPPFSLWFVDMVYDYALWRGDPVFVRERMTGVRQVLDTFLGYRDASGLIAGLPGWNFTDWVAGWEFGMPKDGCYGVSALFNWQLTLVLRDGAEIEEWLGEPELAARNRRNARELAQRTAATFWNEARGLYADDLAHTAFSEHTQCLALLSGNIPPAHAARLAETLPTAELAKTSVYFSHYLFEAYRRLERPDLILARCKDWLAMADNGLKTLMEAPDPINRSDCHAWGAHPLYHSFATLAGIRPAGCGFRAVEIAPQFGSLTRLSAELVHPEGRIVACLSRDGDKLNGQVSLPPGIPGVLRWGKNVRALAAGQTTTFQDLE